MINGKWSVLLDFFLPEMQGESSVSRTVQSSELESVSQPEVIWFLILSHRKRCSNGTYKLP